jgi:hypothetical protein
MGRVDAAAWVLDTELCSSGESGERASQSSRDMREVEAILRARRRE